MNDTSYMVLGFIDAFIETAGYPPSIREIQAGVGISSTSVVAHHLDALERAKMIRRKQDTARTIQVIDSGRNHSIHGVIDGVIAGLKRLPRYQRQMLVDDLRKRLEEIG